MRSRRITEHCNIAKIIQEAEDFYRRSHNFTPIRICYYMAIILLCALFLVQILFGIIHGNLERYQLDNLVISMIFISFLFILLLAIVTFLLYKLQNIILTTEFQNLLFASSARQKSFYFMLLAKNKEDIIYMDAAARSIFQTPQGFITLAEILTKMNLNDAERTALLEQLSKDVDLKIDYQSEGQNINLQFSSLERPSGFFSLKAIKK